jgi:hypothetical protein
MTAITITITEPINASLLEGQVILKISCLTLLKKFNGFCIVIYISKLAGVEGLEPTASGFGDRRSTS